MTEIITELNNEELEMVCGGCEGARNIDINNGVQPGWNLDAGLGQNGFGLNMPGQMPRVHFN